MFKKLKALGSGLVSCVLVACGGSGGAPVPGELIIDTEIRTNNIAITWNSTISSRYFLYSAPGDDPDNFTIYEALQANFIGILLDASVHLFDWEEELIFYVQGCNLNGCSESQTVQVEEDSSLTAIGYFKASNVDDAAADGNPDSFGRAVAMDFFGRRMIVGAPWENNDFSGSIIGGGELEDNELPDNRDDGAAEKSGAVYAFVINAEVDGLATLNDVGRWVQINYIKSPAPDTFDEFGYEVAISADGLTMAVGAPFEDGGIVCVDEVCDFDPLDNSVDDSGAVYVYQNFGEVWEYVAYVKPVIPNENALFGSSIEFDATGDRLFIGAPGEDSCGDPVYAEDEAEPCAEEDKVPNSGAVYVFDGSNSNWSQSQYVRAENPDDDDRFGHEVVADGEGLSFVATAPGEDGTATGVTAIDTPDVGNAGTDVGAAYVRIRDIDDETNEIIWSLQGYLKPGVAQDGMDFGVSIGLSDVGDDVVVGAPGKDGDQGAAYIFHRDESDVWSLTTELEASNKAAGDEFGAAVDIINIPDPDLLAQPGLIDYFGLVVVGAPGEDSSSRGVVGTNEADNGAADSGAAYVFKQCGGDPEIKLCGDEDQDEWAQFRYVKAPNTNGPQDIYGYGFASELVFDSFGTRFASGSPGEASGVPGIGPDGDDADVPVDPEDTSAPGAGATYLY